MISRVFVRMRRVRRWFNRSERAVQWLGLRRDKGSEHEPGLLLIQIDGLGHAQFQRALDKGRLPFLKHLLRREGYSVKSLYAGVPSTTPAVQAELFYGKKTALPAFAYLDPESGLLVKLFDPPAAKRMEQELGVEADGLMAGGAAYGNIFGGGAEEEETHFCVSALGWKELRRSLNPLTFLLLVFLNSMSVLRVAALLVIEFGLALVDFARGIRSGQDLRSEASFIIARVGVCIGLRELIVIGASIDLARGLPIIQVNLAAFDEQSHRRGPHSAFAHWVLKGIDQAIQRLWREAKCSPARDYRVWIYSDHGQETVTPYVTLNGGRKIQAVVADLVQELTGTANDAPDAAITEADDEDGNNQVSYRSKTMSARHWTEGPQLPPHNSFERPARTRVVAMGPVGFIYTAMALTFEQRSTLASTLTRDHAVPCVLGFDDSRNLHAWINGLCLALPEHQAVLLGSEHPFAAQVMDDIQALCKHPGVGDLIISGWRDGVNPVSFALENGSHGGFGPNETHGIALLDSLLELPDRPYEHVRAGDLRLAAMQLLNRGQADTGRTLQNNEPLHKGGKLQLRVMTYNVHSCVGMDRRCSPARIARLIGKFAPDVVALQELDNGKSRSGYVHQAREIAEILNMHFIYSPVISNGEDEYGDALLSRWPLTLVCAESLPCYQDREQRGFVWAEMNIGSQQIQFVNTHLGLSSAERKQQIDALMSDTCIATAETRGPTILLGDFNATGRGYAWKRVARQLGDVQQLVPSWRPRSTWFSTHPSLRLDHIFVSSSIRVDAVHRPTGTDFQMASDHLPLVADLLLPDVRERG
jgi:endonuclease/exonuclease/phosphatase family metal-dependent hydrolase